MPLLHIVILAIVQGISEFLPISSSGHLIITHALLGTGGDNWGDSLTLDIAVHIGTLLAALIYFRADILAMLRGLVSRQVSAENETGKRLAFFLVAASVPILVLGFVLHLTEPSWLRSVTVTAWALIIFGVLLGVVDRIKPSDRTISSLGFREAMIIGFAQMLSMIPGTSRSGITMTAARFLGLSRVEAARFSLLLGIVAISAAGLVGIVDLFEKPDPDLWLTAAAGIAVSFLAGISAIHVLLKWLARSTLMPFAIYRVVLGALLLVLVYTGAL